MARVTFPIAFVFVLVLFPTIANAAVLVARASGSPAYVAAALRFFVKLAYQYSSCASCPEADKGGYGRSVQKDSNGVLLCVYPSFGLEKPYPNNWNCTYNDVRMHYVCP